MQIIPFPEEINSLKLFPENIETHPNVYFHGTNNIYASFIEKCGFIPNYSPLPDFFYDLLELIEDIKGSVTENTTLPENFINKTESIIRYFNNFTRISFSAVSICAASYSIGNSSGGSCIKNLIDLKNAILSLKDADIENLNILISDNFIDKIERLDAAIKNFGNQDGVVYAIEFDNDDISFLRYSNHRYHGVLLSSKPISSERIIAKMIIPKDTKLDDRILNLGNKATLDLCTNGERSFLNSIINLNNKRNLLSTYLSGNKNARI